MAIVVTNVTPNTRYTPFTGLTELERSASGIARAEEVKKASGSWPGPGAGNTRILNFNHTLDPDYGYVVMDCFAKLYAGGQIETETVAAFQIQTTPGHPENEIIETQLISEAGRQNSAGTTAIGSIDAASYNTFFPADAAANGSITYRLAEPKPSMLIFPFAQTGYPPSITVTFAEQFSSAVDYNYYFYLRLLQYDISQGYNYVIQSPQLTR